MSVPWEPEESVGSPGLSQSLEPTLYSRFKHHTLPARETCLSSSGARIPLITVALQKSPASFHLI